MGGCALDGLGPRADGASGVDGQQLELDAVGIEERHERDREALHGVDPGVGNAHRVEVRGPGMEVVFRRHLETEVIEAGPRAVEALARIRGVVVESDAEGHVGGRQYDGEAALVAVVVGFLEPPAQPEDPLVPGGARLDISHGEPDVMDGRECGHRFRPRR
jgi:hypothetical protein